jgi:hypothetical protein
MTLKITELQNAAGNITYAMPRAMARFTTTNDTINIVNSYNIDSIIWYKQGFYRVVFKAGTMPDANYAIQWWGSIDITGRNPTFVMHMNEVTDSVEKPPTSDGFNISLWDNDTNEWDPAEENYILCFR